jgi:hypothetical protein
MSGWRGGGGQSEHWAAGDDAPGLFPCLQTQALAIIATMRGGVDCVCGHSSAIHAQHNSRACALPHAICPCTELKMRWPLAKAMPLDVAELARVRKTFGL